MQYAFYAGVLVFFIFAIFYFRPSDVNRSGSSDVGARISDSKAVGAQLQGSNKEIESNVRTGIDQIGSAEAELERAAAAIGRCEQILERAKQRTQEANEKTK